MMNTARTYALPTQPVTTVPRPKGHPMNDPDPAVTALADRLLNPALSHFEIVGHDGQRRLIRQGRSR